MTVTAPLLDGSSFRVIADVVHRESGLFLVPEKAAMVQSRLRHRLSALGLSDYSAYGMLLQSNSGDPERRQLVSALTTNVSAFFREPHHFDTMIDWVNEHLQALRGGKPLRIWSAGCAHGQEPLSIAMCLLEHVPQLCGADLRILATDIDETVIQFARARRYPEPMLRGLTASQKRTYFDVSVNERGSQIFSPKQKLSSLIQYNSLNLLREWPMHSPFDIIFCRNLIIYFDASTQQSIWPKFHHTLKQDGLLFLGHAERIADPGILGFRRMDCTTYQPVET